MKKRAFLVLFLILAALALQSTATCPYCGQTAYATGNTKTIYLPNGGGAAKSCEYSHPIDMNDSSKGRHVFWQLCN